MLTDQDLFDIVEKDKPTVEADIAAWTKRDSIVRVRIGLSVKDDELIHIRSAETAKVAWEALKDYHQKATLTSKVLLLKRLCRTVLTEDGDMESHISTFAHI